jgi:hypothetical protein
VLSSFVEPGRPTPAWQPTPRAWRLMITVAEELKCRTSPTTGGGRPDLLKRKLSLLAQCAEDEVDRLASHPPLAERDNVGKGIAKVPHLRGPGASPAAAPEQGSPNGDDVVADGDPPSSPGTQIRERREVLRLVGRSDRVPASRALDTALLSGGGVPMACPVCGNKELIVISERWETCSA